MTTYFPVFLPRDAVLLDQPLRRMPRVFRLQESIPDKLDEDLPGEVELDEARQARSDFLAWWHAYQAFLATENVELRPVAAETAPYYGADSCVLFPGKK